MRSLRWPGPAAMVSSLIRASIGQMAGSGTQNDVMKKNLVHFYRLRVRQWNLLLLPNREAVAVSDFQCGQARLSAASIIYSLHPSIHHRTQHNLYTLHLTLSPNHILHCQYQYHCNYNLNHSHSCSYYYCHNLSLFFCYRNCHNHNHSYNNKHYHSCKALPTPSSPSISSLHRRSPWLGL
jgi:hypothetical protein